MTGGTAGAIGVGAAPGPLETALPKGNVEGCGVGEVIAGVGLTGVDSWGTAGLAEGKKGLSGTGVGVKWEGWAGTGTVASPGKAALACSM